MDSQVRVGVRVRPLTSRELGEGGQVVVNAWNPEISLGTNRRFTYDSVFDSNVSQANLYDNVSKPLLQAYLEGYNATVCTSTTTTTTTTTLDRVCRETGLFRWQPLGRYGSIAFVVFAPI